MNYLTNSVIAIVTLFTITGAYAQVCPPSVEIVSAVRGVLPGWDAVSMSSMQTLSGVDIVTGKLNYDDEGQNAILRPLDEPNGDYFWKFIGPVGDEEVWMRCSYHETAVRLDRRVDAAAKECRVTKLVPTKRGKKSIVSAVCK
jgi:hypothetical protein